MSLYKFCIIIIIIIIIKLVSPTHNKGRCGIYYFDLTC